MRLLARAPAASAVHGAKTAPVCLHSLFFLFVSWPLLNMSSWKSGSARWYPRQILPRSPQLFRVLAMGL